MKTAKPKCNDASLCRAKGWKVGDILRCEPTERSAFGGSFTARITAIGEDSILVRRTIFVKEEPERRWSRHLLDYVISLEKSNDEGV